MGKRKKKTVNGGQTKKFTRKTAVHFSKSQREKKTKYIPKFFEKVAGWSAANVKQYAKKMLSYRTATHMTEDGFFKTPLILLIGGSGDNWPNVNGERTCDNPIYWSVPKEDTMLNMGFDTKGELPPHRIFNISPLGTGGHFPEYEIPTDSYCQEMGQELAYLNHTKLVHKDRKYRVVSPYDLKYKSGYNPEVLGTLEDIREENRSQIEKMTVIEHAQLAFHVMIKKIIRIEQKRPILVGHSQGAQIAMTLAGHPGVAAIMALRAAPFLEATKIWMQTSQAPRRQKIDMMFAAEDATTIIFRKRGDGTIARKEDTGKFFGTRMQNREETVIENHYGKKTMNQLYPSGDMRMARDRGDQYDLGILEWNDEAFIERQNRDSPLN